MEHFIETVRKYPCLWNSSAIEYRDQELKDAAWAEVMRETNLASVKEVKNKWKKLRDSYRDALKRQSDSLAKEPSNQAKKNYNWKYMGSMQFLQPHMNNRNKKPHVSETHQYAAASIGTGQHQQPIENGQRNGIESRSTDESDSEPDSSPKRKSSERLTVIDRKLDYLCKAQNQSKRLCTDQHHQERERRRDPQTAPAPVPAPPPDPLDIFFNGMCQATKRLPYPTQIKIKKVLFGAVVEAEEALLAEQQNYACLWAQAASSSSSDQGDDEPEQKEAKVHPRS